MLTYYNRGKTELAKFINHNLKETASTVLRWLLIKNGVTIQFNPIQSMYGSNQCQTVRTQRLLFLMTYYIIQRRILITEADQTDSLLMSKHVASEICVDSRHILTAYLVVKPVASFTEMYLTCRHKVTRIHTSNMILLNMRPVPICRVQTLFSRDISPYLGPCPCTFSPWSFPCPRKLIPCPWAWSPCWHPFSFHYSISLNRTPRTHIWFDHRW